jgi:hypothetical protein
VPYILCVWDSLLSPSAEPLAKQSADMLTNKDPQSNWRSLINSSNKYLLVKAQNFRSYFPTAQLNSCADYAAKKESGLTKLLKHKFEG